MWQLAAGALGGTCFVLVLPRLPAWSLLLTLGSVLVFVAWRLRLPWLGALALAGVYGSWHLDGLLEQRLAHDLQGVVMHVRGTVVSVPQGELDLLRFRFEPDTIIDGPPHARLPRLVELTWYDAPARIGAAERLELLVKLRRPRGFCNPGGRDNEARLLHERIGATGYVRAGWRLGRRPEALLRHPALIVRGYVADVIRRELGDRPAAGIVAGLAVGLQDALDRDQWRVLSLTGTSHLMAISGLHITMVAAIGAWLGAALQRLRQYAGALGARRDAAVIAGTLTALGYSLLAGWSVPTQRTMVMLGAAALALLLRRRVGIADGLGLCVCCVLALDPLAPLAPGFWLSFGAVAALLFAATGHVRPGSMLRRFLAVQAVVTIGLIPVLGASFGAISLVSALVNLYAIPLYTLFIVPAVLLSCSLAIAVPHAGSPMLAATAGIIEATWPWLEIPAGWTFASWPIAGLDALASLALVVGAIALLAPLTVPARVAGAMLVLSGCLSHPTRPAVSTARISVLDVGQGLAVVVETRTHALVYDAGPSFRTGSDTGQLVVVPYLRHRGIRALDLVVVSHDDDDHKGGVRSVVEQIPTRRMVTGAGVTTDLLDDRAHLVHAEACRRGNHWTWDGVDFEWLHPGPGTYGRDNDGSCVLAIRAGDRSALLTGDVETAGEQEMVDAGRLAHAFDVVVVPHHGSRTSSSTAFVSRTRPAWAVHSSGHRNRWKFPAPAVVERWHAAGARQRRTSASGAITFELVPGRTVAPPFEWRRDRPRSWREP